MKQLTFFRLKAPAILSCAIAACLIGCTKEKGKPETEYISDQWEATPSGDLPAAQPGATNAPAGPVRLTVESGTRGMAILLRQIDELALRAPSQYHNEIRANDWLKVIEAQTDAKQAIALLGDYSTELLRAGRSEESIAALRTLREEAAKAAPEFIAKHDYFVRFNEALSNLRLGEQQNCIGKHSADSCLFPIAGGGIHTLPQGSTEAMRLFIEILQKEPDNLPAAWLLNIAAMTLDKFPDAVPERWRLPADALKSDHDIKRFPDIAHGVGLAVNGYAGGVVMDDFNKDGFLDLMASSWSLKHQIQLFMNKGDGTFEESSAKAGLTGITGGLNMVHADYNNDGNVDVFVLRGAWREKVGNYPNSLLRNNGDGTWDDVTKEARILSLHPTQSAAWFDYDNDGWLDLFVVNESVGPVKNPCELYHNRGDGTFVNVAKPCAVEFEGLFKAVVAGDYDNDGRPDLYLSRLFGRNILLHNEGPVGDEQAAKLGAWKFRDVAEKAGVSGPELSFPGWFFDYDNDGWLDLFVSDYDIGSAAAVASHYFGKAIPGDRAKLYRNRGDGTFIDMSAQAGLDQAMLTMGSNFGDLDNDGWLDFLLGTGAPNLTYLFPNRMFRNNAGKNFQDVTTSGGFGQLQKGHGVAFGDLDNDGDQDIYAVIGGAYSGDNYFNALYQNPGHGANWVKIRLTGDKSNRSAIGARLKLTVDAGGNVRQIHRVVGSGGSFGCNPLMQEVGLGASTVVKKLEIHWPTSGTTQVFEDLPSGRLHEIVEGASKITTTEPKAIQFRLGKGHAHH